MPRVNNATQYPISVDPTAGMSDDEKDFMHWSNQPWVKDPNIFLNWSHPRQRLEGAASQGLVYGTHLGALIGEWRQRKWLERQSQQRFQQLLNEALSNPPLRHNPLRYGLGRLRAKLNDIVPEPRPNDWWRVIGRRLLRDQGRWPEKDRSVLTFKPRPVVYPKILKAINPVHQLRQPRVRWTTAGSLGGVAAGAILQNILNEMLPDPKYDTFRDMISYMPPSIARDARRGIYRETPEWMLSPLPAYGPTR